MPSMTLEELTSTSSLDEVESALKDLKMKSGGNKVTLQKGLIRTKLKLKELGLKTYIPLATLILHSGGSGGGSNSRRPSKSLTKQQLVVEGDSKIGEEEKGDGCYRGGASLLNQSNIQPTVDEIVTQVQQSLELTDIDAIEIAMAVAAIHNQVVDSPPWLYIVDASGSGKTELVEMFTQCPKVYSMSDLTPKTLISGLGAEDSEDGQEPSLLLKLTDNIVTLKDFTTILSTHKDSMGAIFGQLREVFDGKFSKDFGNGKRIDWVGKLSMLVGVTPVIDHHHKVIAALGPRFLFVRPRKENRDKAARRALTHVKGWRLPIQDLMARFMRHLPTTPIALTESNITILSALADIVSSGRSDVWKDHEGNIEEVGLLEFPTRVVKQLAYVLYTYEHK